MGSVRGRSYCTKLRGYLAYVFFEPRRPHLGYLVLGLLGYRRWYSESLGGCGGNLRCVSDCTLDIVFAGSNGGEGQKRLFQHTNMILLKFHPLNACLPHHPRHPLLQQTPPHTLPSIPPQHRPRPDICLPLPFRQPHYQRTDDLIAPLRHHDQRFFRCTAPPSSMPIIRAVTIRPRMARRRRALEQPAPIYCLCSENVSTRCIADGDELDHYRARRRCEQGDRAEPVRLQGQYEDEGRERIFVEEN